MSSEDLQSDLASNMEAVKNLTALSNISDVVDHLKQTLWPMLEAMVNEHADLDAALADLYHNAEDILQYETGKLFAAVVVGAEFMMTELANRAGNDARLLKAIKELREKCKEAKEIIEEITLPEDPDGDEDDEDEDEEDDKAADKASDTKEGVSA